MDLARTQGSGGKKEGWGSIFRKALEGTTNRVEKKKKKKKDPWAVSLEADMRRAAREGNTGSALRGQTATTAKKVSKKIPAFLSRLYPGQGKPKGAICFFLYLETRFFSSQGKCGHGSCMGVLCLSCCYVAVAVLCTVNPLL